VVLIIAQNVEKAHKLKFGRMGNIVKINIFTPLVAFSPPTSSPSVFKIGRAHV
jgi:hypothetical protein